MEVMSCAHEPEFVSSSIMGCEHLVTQLLLCWYRGYEWQSEVINQYLLDKFAEYGPSFVPATAEERAKVALVTRIHDCYISNIQGILE